MCIVRTKLICVAHVLTNLLCMCVGVCGCVCVGVCVFVHTYISPALSLPPSHPPCLRPTSVLTRANCYLADAS
jgi:hypothetical protein